ncbi:MAG: BlaI/MecI/CopY family transcriptional regulator [Clostridia bacterium]
MYNKRLPEAELEIMLVIWESDEPVNSDYLLEKLEKNWVKPTLLNLLSRLEKRGFVKFTKNGRFNMYYSTVKKEEYLQQETTNFFKKMYGGSLKNLVANLYDGNNVTSDDLKELEEYIKGAK